MHFRLAAVLIAGSAALAGVAQTSFAEAAKWTCTKDKEELKVEGKDAKQKKKSCEDQGGEWKKAEGAKKQSSGGGGGW